MTVAIFTPDQLSNEQYQALPQRSGSFLHRLLIHSPAKARFGEIPSRKALDFGIWSHAMMLEPERFKEDYARDFDPSIYDYILRKGDDYKAWLKERGMKVSGSNAELIERILEVGEPVHIEEVERQIFRNNAEEDVEFIPTADFDKIELMRHALFADESAAKLLTSGYAEHSIVTPEFKARPDLITGATWIINYKSTNDAEPEKFGRKAVDYGYPMRACMEVELFKQAYGEYPAGYAILAQEKDSPYLCKTFVIYDRARGDEQPDAYKFGRQQLTEAVKIYRKCRDADVWPGLGKAEDLPMPEYLMKRAALI